MTFNVTTSITPNFPLAFKTSRVVPTWVTFWMEITALSGPDFDGIQ